MVSLFVDLGSMENFARIISNKFISNKYGSWEVGVSTRHSLFVSIVSGNLQIFVSFYFVFRICSRELFVFESSFCQNIWLNILPNINAMLNLKINRK